MAETKLFRFRLAGEPFGKHRRADGTLKLLVPKLQSDGPPLTVLNPETGGLGHHYHRSVREECHRGPARGADSRQDPAAGVRGLLALAPVAVPRAAAFAIDRP